MKLYQVLGFPQFYQGIDMNKNLPFALAYKFNKLANKANEEINFYRENMQKIIEEYAERDENGEMIFTDAENVKLRPDSTEECNKKINELSNIEVDINIKFTPEELSSLELSINDLQTLMPLIEE